MTSDQSRTILADALVARRDTLGNCVLRGDVMATAHLARFDLVKEMAQQVTNDVWLSVEALLLKQFIPYDPSYQTSVSQVLVEELTLIPDLAALDSEIRVGDMPNDGGGEPVVAMAHAVGSGEHQVVAYRVKGAGIATRRAKWVQLIPRDGVYTPIDEEVLFYEPRFEVLTCRGYAYFTTASLIQSKLNAPDKARQLAKATLAKVTKKVAIDGLAELERSVMEDPSMRAKMAYIARLLDADPYYAKKLTTESLIKFVEDNPEYNVCVSEMGGEKALKFDPSPQHRHQIPKLLADDYLHSQLTDRHYEAGSKHRVTK